MHLAMYGLPSNEIAVDIRHIYYTLYRIKLSFRSYVDLNCVRMAGTKILPLFELQFVIVCFRRLQSHCVTASVRQTDAV
jgi:hypothetical protein